MRSRAQSIRPFAGVVLIALIVGVARAIEGPGRPATGHEDFSPGGVALVGAAAVYAARTIYELVLERKSIGNGNGKLEAAQQRLLDLYANHAHTEERLLAEISAAISEVRDHVLAAASSAASNGQQIQVLAAQHATMHGLIGQVQQALSTCLAIQRGGRG